MFKGLRMLPGMLLLMMVFTVPSFAAERNIHPGKTTYDSVSTPWGIGDIASFINEAIDEAAQLPGIGDELVDAGIQDIDPAFGVPITGIEWGDPLGHPDTMLFNLNQVQYWTEEDIKRVTYREIGKFVLHKCLADYYGTTPPGTNLSSEKKAFMIMYEHEMLRHVNYIKDGTTSLWDTWDMYYDDPNPAPVKQNLTCREDIFCETFSFWMQFDTGTLPQGDPTKTYWDHDYYLWEPMGLMKLLVYNAIDPDMYGTVVVWYPGYGEWDYGVDNGSTGGWVFASFPFTENHANYGLSIDLKMKYQGNWQVVSLSSPLEAGVGYSIHVTKPQYRVCVGTPADITSYSFAGSGWYAVSPPTVMHPSSKYITNDGTWNPYYRAKFQPWYINKLLGMKADPHYNLDWLNELAVYQNWKVNDANFSRWANSTIYKSKLTDGIDNKYMLELTNDAYSLNIESGSSFVMFNVGRASSFSIDGVTWHDTDVPPGSGTGIIDKTDDPTWWPLEDKALEEIASWKNNTYFKNWSITADFNNLAKSVCVAGLMSTLMGVNDGYSNPWVFAYDEYSITDVVDITGNHTDYPVDFPHKILTPKNEAWTRSVLAHENMHTLQDLVINSDEEAYWGNATGLDHESMTDALAKSLGNPISSWNQSYPKQTVWSNGKNAYILWRMVNEDLHEFDWVNDVPEFEKGDLNRDGMSDGYDDYLIAQSLVGAQLTRDNFFTFWAADLNRDGIIDTAYDVDAMGYSW